jgi:hypothetical protein
MDSGVGLISEDDRKSIALLLQQSNPTEQRKVLTLFRRPLGKRTGIPAACRSSPPPYRERFDMAWALRERDLAETADQARDALGLVHFRRGEDLVFITYRLAGNISPRVPTVVEAMGGWAYWPARDLGNQTSLDYHKGIRGLQEFVHSADVPPGTMRVRWMGRLMRNWDDP